ncbi:hypothetical protein C0Q70_11272 [Pomacea canaliculata]|uniref:RING-type domain-containing protein n=1 Tax=Pomacea canaliculata TaxID=400727 RepID=A0A2T7P5I9_POMCA|nr:hypothetical protein C0Q70_11272 [Pomacea canaliculata]
MNSNQNKTNDFGENVHLRDGVNPVDERIKGSNSDSTDYILQAVSAPDIEGQRDISLNNKLQPDFIEQTWGEIQTIATGADEYGTSYRLQQLILDAEHRLVAEGLDQTAWMLLHSFSLHFRQPLQSSGNNSRVYRDVENGGGSGWHQYSEISNVKKDGNLSQKDNVLAAAKLLTEASKLIDKQKLMENGKKRGPYVSGYNEEPVHHHTSTIVHPQQSISLPEVRDENSAREDYKHELRRLASFSDLPATFKFFVIRLANAGFYCNQDKIIRCFFCNFEKSDWKLLENPLQIHHHRPQCSIVTGINCENVPIMLPSAEQEKELRQLWSLTEGKMASRPLQMQSVTSILQPVLGGTTLNMSASGAQVSPPVAAFGQDAGTNSTDSITSQPGLLGAAGTELVVDGTLEGSESKGRGESVSVIAPGSPALQPEFQIASLGQPTPTSASQQLASNLVTDPNSTAQLTTNASRVDSSSLSCSHSLNDSTSQPESGSSESGPRTGEGQQVVTYQQLGILTESPKHLNMAVYQERINSFRNWPHRTTRPQLIWLRLASFMEDMETVDDASSVVEVSRIGKPVTILGSNMYGGFHAVPTFVSITMEDVKSEMNNRRAHGERLQETLVDPAIKSVTELGYAAAQVDMAVQQLRQQGLALTASHLIDLLQREGLQAAGGVDEGESDVEIEYLEELGRENSEIRQQHICKICLDRDVCIVFLPCGHLVCCAECSPALTTCPVCRQRIKGRVRAFSP